MRSPATVAPMVNSTSPQSSTGSRPSRSDILPYTIVANAITSMARL